MECLPDSFYVVSGELNHCDDSLDETEIIQRNLGSMISSSKLYRFRAKSQHIWSNRQQLFNSPRGV